MLSIRLDAFTRGLSRLISHFLHFRLIFQLLDTSARNGWAAALLVRYFHCNLSFFAAVSNLLICFDAFTRGLSRLISHFLHFRLIFQLMDTSARNGWAAAIGQVFSLQPFILCSCFEFANLFRRIYKRTLASHQPFPSSQMDARLWTLRLLSCWLSHFTGQAFSLQLLILCNSVDVVNSPRRIYKRTLASHQPFPSSQMDAHLWTLRLLSCWLSHFTGQAFSLQRLILCNSVDVVNSPRRIYKRTLASHQPFPSFQMDAHLWTLRLLSCWLSHFTGQAFSLQLLILCNSVDVVNSPRRIYKRTLASHQPFPLFQIDISTYGHFGSEWLGGCSIGQVFSLQPFILCSCFEFANLFRRIYKRTLASHQPFPSSQMDAHLWSLLLLICWLSHVTGQAFSLQLFILCNSVDVVNSPRRIYK